MVRRRFILVLILVCVALVSDGSRAEARPSSARVGNCPVFPADNPWNRDVSHDPVHPRSADYIRSIWQGPNKFLRAGFGLWPEFGLPYTIVPGSQPKVPINFTD